MFKKVLIVEDHESANLSVRKVLEEMGIADPEYVFYCDDALLKVRKGKEEGDAYDLLITDLYFEADHQRQQLTGGAQLIAAARRVQPELRVLVFSAEGKVSVIEALYTTENIDGYVQKGRHDARELKEAVERIAGNERYFPRFWVHVNRQTNVHDFSAYDITIISLMAQGRKQKDIPDYLRENGVKPVGLSSVEKRLNHIREALNFTSNEQLVAYCIDMGIV